MKSSINCILYDILICNVGYVTPNGVKPLYLIINRINGYIEESYGKVIWHYFPLMKANIYLKIWIIVRKNQRSY